MLIKGADDKFAPLKILLTFELEWFTLYIENFGFKAIERAFTKVLLFFRKRIGDCCIMKKLISKCVVLVIVVAMIVSVLPFFGNGALEAEAYSFTGQDANTTTNIYYNGTDTGIDYTYAHLGSGGSAGWGANRKINIVEGNLASNPALGFEVMNHGTYIKDSATLTSVVANYKEGDKKILAAVNGDWMTWTSNLPGGSTDDGLKWAVLVTFSAQIADGEIWCSQMYSAEQNADYYTLGVTTSKQVIVGKPKVTTTIKNVSTGASFSATGINRAPVANTLTVFNNRLNSATYVNDDAYEVAIKTSSPKLMNGGTLTGTVEGIYPSGTTSRPALDGDTVMITARGSQIATIQNKFAVGQTVTITTSVYDSLNNISWSNVDEAIGGQCLVMRNGSIYNDLGASAGQNTHQYPSNIIGTKSNGSLMMAMVTADANGVRTGLQFNRIPAFCQAIGYSSAFLLDGGGSTTMVTLENGTYKERANYSDGSQRATWNSCAITYEAESFKFPTEVKNVLFDAQYYYANNADLQSAFGQDEAALFNHFVNNGIGEGRRGSNLFSADEYINQNSDIQAAFGFDSSASSSTKAAQRKKAVMHFGENGAFKDELDRYTSSKFADLGDDFYAKINLTNATLNVASSGTSIIANTKADTAEQKWHFVKLSDGSYKIINMSNNYLLEVANGTKTTGATVQLSSTDSGASKQHWYVFAKYNYSGQVVGYILRSVATPACVLTVSSATPSAGTAMKNNTYTLSSAQIFTIEKIEIITRPSGHVDLGTNFFARINTKLASGKGLTFSGTNVVLGTTKADASFAWLFVRLSDGSYIIKNQNNGYVLTVANNSDANSANVTVAAYTEATGQKWFIYGTSSGYTILPACSGDKYLDVANDATADGTNIAIYTGDNSNAQAFTLTTGGYFDLVNPIDVGTNFIGHLASGTQGLSLTGVNATYKTSSSSDKTQQYYFERQSDGSYKLTNVRNRYVLTAKGTTSGSKVEVVTEESSNQKWFIYVKEGKFLFKAANTSLVLGASGTNAVITALSGETSQYFNITNLGAADFEIPKATTTGALTTDQVTAVYDSLCAANSSFASMDATTLKQDIATYALEAYNLGVKDVKAIAMCVNIRALSSTSELTRVLAKTGGNYSLESIYAALLTDTGSQVGTNRASHWNFYKTIVTKL